MLSTKSEYLHLFTILILSLIKTHFFKEKIYGTFPLKTSIIMDYMDNGDLYQAIVDRKKKKLPF